MRTCLSSRPLYLAIPVFLTYVVKWARVQCIQFQTNIRLTKVFAASNASSDSDNFKANMDPKMGEKWPPYLVKSDRSKS